VVSGGEYAKISGARKFLFLEVLIPAANEDRAEGPGSAFLLGNAEDYAVRAWPCGRHRPDVKRWNRHVRAGWVDRPEKSISSLGDLQLRATPCATCP